MNRYIRFIKLLTILVVVCLTLKLYSHFGESEVASFVTVTETLSTYSNEAIDAILRDCGELCDTSRVGLPGPYFDHITASVDCLAIFKNEYIDRTHGLRKAPREIPENLKKYFTMNGKIKVQQYYWNEPYLSGKAYTPIWTKHMVNKMLAAAKEGKLDNPYGVGESNAVRDGLQHAPGILNGRVLVIGSERPWVEACVLEAGAKDIVTLEYGNIKSEHKQIKTMTPSQFRSEYLNNTLGTFDAVVTFSSVEHSGLGRYGDALNPWGDILAVARAWCVTKKGGSLTIGVEYDYNNERIEFNAHRIYGKFRYPYLVSNWKQYYKGKGKQLVHIFIK